jgi:hypothetical protein
MTGSTADFSIASCFTFKLFLPRAVGIAGDPLSFSIAPVLETARNSKCNENWGKQVSKTHHDK